MANNIKVMDSIKNFLVKMKASDADIPEELAHDACEMVEEVKDALCESEEVEETKETKDEDKDESELEEKIESKIADAFDKVMRKYGLVKDGAMEALDELENKLGEEGTEDVDGEEEVTVDPAKINDAAKRKLLREVKPVIASVKDSVHRKKLADAFAKSLSMKSATYDYSSIVGAANSSAKNNIKVHDENSVNENFGDYIAKKYNPHYKEEN